MLALLYSLGMFIVVLFKSRRRARTMVQISIELGGDHAVQDNRNTAAQRGGTYQLRGRTDHTSPLGDHPNSDRRHQTAERNRRAALIPSSWRPSGWSVPNQHAGIGELGN